jgi:hypothetical protein
MTSTERDEDLAAITEETRAAHRALLDHRDAIERGEATWESMAAFFTDDVVYIDPAWGRVEGIDEVRTFLRESMAGLDTWRFPERWTMVEGRRVVTAYDQIIPAGDGTTRVQPGISVLYYGGDGQFAYEMDLMNMAHINEDLRAVGWAPPEGFNFPPRNPDRDHTLGRHVGLEHRS